MTWYSFLGLTSSPQRVVFSDPKLDVRIRAAENSTYSLFVEMTAVHKRLDALDVKCEGLMVGAAARNSTLESAGPLT